MHPYALAKHRNDIVNYYFSKNQIDSYKMHRISTKYISKLKAQIYKIYTKPSYVIQFIQQKSFKTDVICINTIIPMHTNICHIY